MRTRNLRITLILALAVTIIAFACNKQNVLKPEPVLMDFEQFEIYGEIHNEFLTNAYENFSPTENTTGLDEALNYVNDFQHSFLSKINLNRHQKELLSSALSENKRLVIYNESYERFFLSSNARTISNDEPSIFEMIEGLKKQGVLDEFEYKLLTKLGEAIRNSFEGLITDDDLNLIILSLKKDWEEKQYTNESQNGQMSAFILAISSASTEWWQENPEAGVTTNPNGRINALPAWAALDVAGAIIGAGSSTVIQYGVNGDVNWEIVGWSALGGAISGSTGAVGKLGRYFTAALPR